MQLTAESAAWLHTLPMLSLGLRMDNEVICVVVGLWLGVPRCYHVCHLCEARVDSLGTRDLHCSRSIGHHPATQQSMRLLREPWRQHLEPVGTCRADRKQSDGTTVTPRQRGHILIWDVTCLDTFAPSHQQLVVRETGAVAAQAEHPKQGKYAQS